jgi:hypothetical protein
MSSEMVEKSPLKAKFDRHARENEQANRLVEELESVAGAKRLGDAAFETAKKNLTKQTLKP